MVNEGRKNQGSGGESKEKRDVFELTAHPLIVLAVSVLIGSIAVPLIMNSIEGQRRDARERRERALAILNTANDIERDLNRLLTEFEAFFKKEWLNDGDPDGEFRRRAWAHYQSFDERAWWWWNEEFQRFSVLGLIETKRLERMNEHYDKYRISLVETVQAFEPLWEIAASPPNELEAGAALKAVQHTRNQAAKHFDERRRLISSIVEELEKGRL